MVSNLSVELRNRRQEIVEERQVLENLENEIPSSSTSGAFRIEGEDGYMEGIPGTYYGGYGHCYRCGRRGHWSKGCPY
ncbi:hypothetical protein C0J52_27606 [Blattella germanica]|nr:hypothetical protein C0J52_27606 [Blattella germanica]